MSILGLSSHSTNSMMSTVSSSGSGSGSLFEFKKQASFYIKEKIKTARLALTDVTPAQILTEESTNGNPWSPDTRTLGLISRAAFEVDDYWRIVEILHNRLSKFDRNNWRPSYKALIVLERLLTHGPESVAQEFQDEKEGVIKQMQLFQHIDEKGFNWGLAVRKKSERLLKLLERGPLLKEERHRARKLTREIKGFGSFTHRTSSEPQGILEEAKSSAAPSHEAYGRCHSQFNEHGNRDINCEDNSLTKKVDEKQQQQQLNPEAIDTGKWFDDNSKIIKDGSKENMAPPLVGSSLFGRKLRRWSGMEEEEEANSLIESCGTLSLDEEDHPFTASDKVSKASLLALSEELD